MRVCFRVLVLLAAATGCAFPDDMQWIGPWGGTWTNAYTSPYYATDDGTPVTIFCLDYNHEIAPPYDWFANVNPLELDNLSKFQFGGSYSDAYQRYVEAAWLFTQAEAALTASDTNAVTAYQVAAWTLFVDGDHLDGLNANIAVTGIGGEVDQAVHDAQGAFTSGWSAAGWDVVTGDSGKNGEIVQEFLLLDPPSVPEPSAVILLGTVLLILGFALRRSKRLC